MRLRRSHISGLHCNYTVMWVMYMYYGFQIQKIKIKIINMNFCWANGLYSKHCIHLRQWQILFYMYYVQQGNYGTVYCTRTLRLYFNHLSSRVTTAKVARRLLHDYSSRVHISLMKQNGNIKLNQVKIRICWNLQEEMYLINFLSNKYMYDFWIPRKKMTFLYYSDVWVDPWVRFTMCKLKIK